MKMTISLHPELIEHAANHLSDVTIGAAFEVHRHLGPGLLESSYHACLCRELALRGIAYDSLLPIHSAQLITYMRLQGVPSGLLMNFNVRLLPHGIKGMLL